MTREEVAQIRAATADAPPGVALDLCVAIEALWTERERAELRHEGRLAVANARVAVLKGALRSLLNFPTSDAVRAHARGTLAYVERVSAEERMS